MDRHFYLSPHTEPVLQTQKLLLANTYPLKNCDKTLLVLNMHAINFVGVKKYIDQLDQLDAVLASHPGPVILGGDFNTWNPGRLMHFNNVADKAGLVEAAMQRPKKLSHLNQHLDHLFYRGLTLRSVESLRYVTSSDHAPITATFESL
jgi:endonuclease/exonuclease/phosphatase (EEP) superfamily protein YafD